MRTTSLRTLLLPALSAALLVACDSSSGKPSPAGTADAIDDAIADHDATGAEDTTTAAADTTTVAPGCDESGFTAAVTQFGKVGSGVTSYQEATSEEEPYDLLSFDIYVDNEYDGATGPGTYDLSGLNYKDCANCVLIRTGCMGPSCDKTYYASTGALVIEHWSEQEGFAGYLDGVVLDEVTIDSSSFESTLVPGGKRWCLDGYRFHATVTGPIIGGENTQPECVAEGTGTHHLLNDNIADFSLPNCNGDMVSIHGGCGTTKALLLLGTAGSCLACDALIAQYVADHGGSLSRDKVNEKRPGMDMLIILGADNEDKQPSQDYCADYAKNKNIDPAMVLIDHSLTTVPIDLVDPVGYALEVNSFATVWSHINPYLRAVGDSVQTSTPWLMLLRGSNMEYVWNDAEGPGTLEAMLQTLLQ